MKKRYSFAPLTALMNLGPSESMVWTCMLTFQGNNKYAWPTQKAISKRLGGKLKPKRISQIIIQLEKKGWMKKIRRGHGKSNLYECLTPSDLLFVPDFGQHKDPPAIPKQEIKKIQVPKEPEKWDLPTLEDLDDPAMREWMTPEEIEETRKCLLQTA